MHVFTLVLAEFVSATLCFALVRFMMRPYQVLGESRYIGLPLGFGFLGTSYILMGLALYFESFPFIEEIKWLQLFTQAYAFAFLATTYYFSKEPYDRRRLWSNIAYAGLTFAAVISYLIAFEPPMLELPSYKTVDEYFRLFNTICLTYITLHTLRSHASRPDPKTIWIPLSYLLLGFSQYSFLIWSLDSSFSAFVGAHLLRLTSLLVFFFVAYQVFYGTSAASPVEGILDEETPPQR